MVAPGPTVRHQLLGSQEYSASWTHRQPRQTLTSQEPSNAELHMIIEPVWTKKENKYVCKNYDLKANKILYIFKNKDII